MSDAVTEVLGWQGGMVTLGAPYLPPDEQIRQDGLARLRYSPADGLEWTKGYGSTSLGSLRRVDPSTAKEYDLLRDTALGDEGLWAWQQIFAEALERVPAVVAVLGHAAGSLALAHLPPEDIGTVLCVQGGACTGKTSALSVGASACGDDRLLRRSWRETEPHFQEMVAAVHHLPIFLDEADAVEQRSLARNLLFVAQGLAWRLNVISGGERDMCGLAGLGGAPVPVLTVGTPMPDQMTAERLRRQAHSHHGLPLVVLARSIARAGVAGSELGGMAAARIKDMEDEITAAVPTNDPSLLRKRRSWAIAAHGFASWGLALKVPQHLSLDAREFRHRVTEAFAGLVREDDRRSVDGA